MTRGEKVDLRVCRNDPETIILSLKGLDGCTLVQVPYPDCFVLSDGNDKILVGVEKAG